MNDQTKKEFRELIQAAATLAGPGGGDRDEMKSRFQAAMITVMEAYSDLMVCDKPEILAQLKES